MKRRRFEFKGGSSYKFWEVTVKGVTQIVTYGRIGFKGVTQSKTFENGATAFIETYKLIASKQLKGYKEVDVEKSERGRPSKKTSLTRTLKALLPMRSGRKKAPKYAKVRSADSPTPQKTVLSKPTPTTETQRRIANLDFDD